MLDNSLRWYWWPYLTNQTKVLPIFFLYFSLLCLYIVLMMTLYYMCYCRRYCCFGCFSFTKRSISNNTKVVSVLLLLRVKWMYFIKWQCIVVVIPTVMCVVVDLSFVLQYLLILQLSWMIDPVMLCCCCCCSRCECVLQ
jgi:hypothetical protein